MNRFTRSTLIGVLVIVATSAATAQSYTPIPVGPPLDLDTAATTNVGGVSVAYNTTDHEYRVFWFDSRIAGENNVYAQRVGPFGALLGANVTIAASPDSRTSTACGYDPRNNNYLVSWQYQGGNPGSPGFNHSYGGLVSATGGLVTTETDLSNAGLEGTIAYSGDEFFLEARNFAGGGPAGILGRRVSLAGAPIGGAITIASAGAPAPAGQVAYSPVSQKYLATWRDQEISNLQGQILNRDGSFGPGPLVLSSVFPGSSLAASVVAGPSGDFFAVFGTFMGGPILGQFISSTGLPVGPTLTLYQTTARVDPFVAYDPHFNVFLLALMDWDTLNVSAVLLDHAGQPLGQPLLLAEGLGLGDARVAANVDLGGFIVAWHDMRNSPERNDIFAQIVGVGTQIPGDLNCDGAVDFGDINPFVLLLSNPGGWQAAFPYCPISNGDINADGHADFADINPFVALLSGL